MENADVILADLAASLSLELLLDASNLLATLTSLSQFALYCHELITPSIDSIIRFIESDLLNAKTKEVNKSKMYITLCAALLMRFTLVCRQKPRMGFL
jgi:hypothetical protein